SVRARRRGRHDVLRQVAGRSGVPARAGAGHGRRVPEDVRRVPAAPEAGQLQHRPGAGKGARAAGGDGGKTRARGHEEAAGSSRLSRNSTAAAPRSHMRRGGVFSARRHGTRGSMQPTPSTKRQASTDGMARIPGGTFRMGSDQHYPEEAAAHKVSVRGFWIDKTTVTNRDFKAFVDATGHVTLAEKPADPANYPGAKPELLVPSSVMFKRADGPVDLRNPYLWWIYVAGADWRHPRGPESSLDGLWDHPVVHVAFEDAEAYARWAGKELPSEAE